MPKPLPLIFDIHRFALDDGPGIRTTVFLKGCPLSCLWCHNPESMRMEREIASHPERCINCAACSRLCPEAAISNLPELQIDRSRCNSCGICADTCPASAIKVIGKEYPLDELMELILLDRHFFASSGGVTFSGGEPTLWMDYLTEALQSLKTEGVHTAIQTCGMFDYAQFAKKILPFIDLIMFDLKLIDPAEHKRYTGRDNRQILDNFRRLSADAGSRLLPRVPLVPGITAITENLLGIASFLADLGHQHCDLLPYNPAGGAKRNEIGNNTSFSLAEMCINSAEVDNLRRMFHERLSQQSGTAV